MAHFSKVVLKQVTWQSMSRWALHWNQALWLAVANHMTSFNHLKHFNLCMTLAQGAKQDKDLHNSLTS